MNKHSDARAEANCNCRTLAAAYLGEPVEDVTLLYHWSTCPLASGERERLAKRWDDPRCATCGEPGMTMTQTWASTSGGSGETTFRVPWCAKHPPVRPNPSPGMVASCGKCGALPSEPCPEPAHCPRVASGERERLDTIMALVLDYGWEKQEAGASGEDWTQAMGEKYAAIEAALRGEWRGTR